MTLPFKDAKKRRSRGSGNGRPSFDPSKHPRGAGGRFTSTAARVEALSLLAGANVAEHVAFAPVRSPAVLSKILGADVRGYKHAVSNQAIAHMKAGHPYLTAEDFKRMPEIVRSGTPALGKDRGINGVPRVVYRAQLDGVHYEYVGEVRRRKRRIDAITLYRL